MSLSASPRRTTLVHLVAGDRKDDVLAALADAETDLVVIDLDDGVAPGNHPVAVAVLTALGPVTDREVLVRVRPGAGLWADLDVLPDWADGVMLARAESPAVVAAVRERLTIDGRRSLWLLVETARGLVNAVRMVEAGGPVDGVAIGAVDLRSDLRLGTTETELELDVPRAQLVIAARASGVEHVVDTPLPRSNRGWGASLSRSRDLGLSGRIVLSAAEARAVRAHDDLPRHVI